MLFANWELNRLEPLEPRRRRWSRLGFLLNLATLIGISISLYRGAHRPVHAQSIDAGAAKRGGHVTFAAVSQSIAANQPATVQLHFRVDSGFHINSHTPKSEILIPTRLIVDNMTGAEVTSVDFPKGTEYSFSFEPGTKLDVYTGDLTLTAHLKAKPGSYVLKGGLRYQACDNAACYPPKVLPVEQAFTAK